MKCPECGAIDLNRVLETFHHHDHIYRRHRCVLLHTWWSHEQTIDALPEFVRRDRAITIKNRIRGRKPRNSHKPKWTTVGVDLTAAWRQGDPKP